MSAVLGSIASAVAGSNSAPKLLAGTGNDKVHLLVVCTAERGLCGAFNSSIVRLAREKINALIAEGKDVKILCVGRKGADQLRRLYGKLIIETVELRGVRVLGFEQGEMIARKIIALFEQGAFDVCHVVLLALPFGDRAGADCACRSSRRCLKKGPKDRGVLRIRAGGRRNSQRSVAAQSRGSGVPRASGKRRVRAGRAHERHGQRHPQCRRNDPQADAHL